MGPWGPLGLFRSYSAWKVISSRGFGRKQNLGPEILQNATKPYHLKHLGGLGPEMIANDTGTKYVGTSALGSKLSKMVPKPSILALNDTLRWVVALNGPPRQGRQVSFKRDPPRVILANNRGTRRTPEEPRGGVFAHLVSKLPWGSV